jgi:hypothetical protein
LPPAYPWGLGNPSTNEEVNYGNCKEEGTSEEGGEEESQEEVAPRS